MAISYCIYKTWVLHPIFTQFGLFIKTFVTLAFSSF